jgi:molybdopterin molybdotransferase
LKRVYTIIESTKVDPVKEYVSMGDSLGRVLASDVISDVDMPPFDKAAVDGFACRRADTARPLLQLLNYFSRDQLHQKE